MIITVISPDVISELYSIVVTCVIHPDSTVDQCVVMAMDDGGVTRTGTCSYTYTLWLASYVYG